ncbi:MAG: BrnA antitoxin family protein [Sedimentitalea sp.]|nr:BrnA antitoxin family protein [Sedimentitalea sp.]
MTYRLTKTERLARRRVIWNLWRSSEDHPPMREVRAEVPDAWHAIVEDIDCHEPKEKVTLYLDRSVARAFKAMGQGYQARINRILLTWIQMKAARMMEADAYLAKREAAALAREQDHPPDARPGWGEALDSWPQAGR